MASFDLSNLNLSTSIEVQAKKQDMERQKMGRKETGTKKRQHNVMLRFNQAEYRYLEKLAKSYDLDITKRGVLSPLLRRLVLGRQLGERDRLPDTSNLAHQVNKVGNNINQLVKLAHHKNMRSANASLENEIRKSNELMRTLIELAEKNYRT